MKRMCNCHKAMCCLSQMCKTYIKSTILYSVINNFIFSSHEEVFHSYINNNIQFASISGISWQ